jgi:hypothetical protein
MQGGHDKVVQHLVDHGAYMSARLLPETPMPQAFSSRRAALMLLLLDLKADNKAESDRAY